MQAAQHHAGLATGATGVDLRVSGVESDGTPAGSTRWTVAFTKPDCRIEVRERFAGVDRPLTRAAHPAGRNRAFGPLHVRM